MLNVSEKWRPDGWKNTFAEIGGFIFEAGADAMWEMGVKSLHAEITRLRTVLEEIEDCPGMYENGCEAMSCVNLARQALKSKLYEDG